MKTKILILTLALVLSLVMVGLALANGIVELPRWVLGGGVSDATSGDIALRATLGQPVVGVTSGGDVTLGQGSWNDGRSPESGSDIYLPLVQR